LSVAPAENAGALEDTMSTITRSGFRSTFESGIDLADQDLKDALRGTGVSEADLKKADLNGDGVVRGRKELDAAFNAVDGVDDNGKANSFLDTDPEAGKVYRGMLAAKAAPPYYGAEIARAAGERVASDGPRYAYDEAPTSPLAGLSGNAHPGVTRPDWLEQRNKCNQFVGDALTQARVKAPTVTMDDGSLHYARAEAWPARSDLFDRVTSASDIKIGDVVMKDYTSSTGTGSAHIEVVTGVNPMKTTGAHDTGAFEQQGNWLAGATYNSTSQTWIRGTDEIYVLRPKTKVDE
jgi:hypothetical protein